MKYDWEDLPERINAFTVKNTILVNLNTGKTVRHYCTNTRITLVQKCVTPEKTYYRTADAAYHYLNYAFEASAFGLPDEKASPAPSLAPSSLRRLSTTEPASRTKQPVKKQKSIQNPVAPKGEEGLRKIPLWRRIFRRKNG